MIKVNPLPPYETVSRLLDYRSDTGELLWKTGQRAGLKAGCWHRGRHKVSIEKFQYQSSRLIWLLQTGQDPGNMYVDHIDRNPGNNKWSNLRLATPSQNARNKNLLRSNRSGYNGVHWCSTEKLWYATITIGGKVKHIGSFDTAEEAGYWAKYARLRIYGEFSGDHRE
jgi:hypothetical protein